MLLPVIVLLLLASLGIGQEQPMAPCMSSSATTAPSCALEYTPWMSPQVAPTMTYYETIMTTYYNIVDCRYCTVTIPDSTMSSTTQAGFTAKTTSPTLTITRVGCMPETTAITRRDIRGYQDVNDIQPRTGAALVPMAQDMQPRAIEAQFSANTLQDIATTIAMHIDPDNTQLSQNVYLDLVSLNTALFAIQYCQSGLNLTDACSQFRQPSTQLQLQSAALNPKQAGDIICWASMFGLNFGMSTMDLLNKMEAVIYALSVGQNFTTDLNQLCNYLDLSFAGYLGIDSGKIWNDACSRTNATNNTAMTITTSASTQLVTGMAGTVGSNGVAPTDEPGPWTNSSIWIGTAGTVGTGGAWPTGGGGPWTNSSAAEATLTFSGATGTGSPWWFPAATIGFGTGNETSGSSVNGTSTGTSGSSNNATESGSGDSGTSSGTSGNATETRSGVGGTSSGSSGSSGNATETGSSGNGTSTSTSGSWGNATESGSGGDGASSGASGNATETGWGGNSTTSGSSGNATETGWGSNGTVSGVGSAGTGLPWGTGWASGTGWSSATGWMSNGTGPLPTGTGVYYNSTVSISAGTGIAYATGWSGNESWTGYVVPTGGPVIPGTAVSFGTGIDASPTEMPDTTDSSSLVGVPVTPTSFETSTTTSGVIRRI